MIRTFFELHRELIVFAHGLVFFILGLSIALQSRSYSRLELARSLRWLAAFGFTHAFYIWGYLFIPIQQAYLPEVVINGLHVLHLILLAVSYTFLFYFGVALIKPSRFYRWLQALTLCLLITWLLITFVVLDPQADWTAWQATSNALARYMIGFTGALLAGYALRKHTMERIAPLKVPHITRMLKISGIMLGIYAFLGGLIPPRVSFFPGSLLNESSFEEIFVAPPAVILSIVGLILVLAIIRALEIFNVETERRIEAMEQQQILAAERNRIARNLHDGAIQKVYTAGLLLESARKLPPGDPELLSSRLQKAETVLNDAIGDLRRNLEELYEHREEETSLIDALQSLTDDPRYHSLIEINTEIHFNGKEEMAPVRVDHLMAIVHEALSNVVRHARATRVSIQAREEAGRLILRIIDNGIGMQNQRKTGYGLRNMRDRARLLGGSIEISSVNGKGSIVELNIPWKDER
jgi:signal transduction histidine kinase